MYYRKETIKTIVVTVNISDLQWKWLEDRSRNCGITVNELMAELMEDLVMGKYYTNVYSYEYGTNWVNGRFLRFTAEKALLSYLNKRDLFDEFMETLDGIEREKEFIEAYAEAEPDPDMEWYRWKELMMEVECSIMMVGNAEKECTEEINYFLKKYPNANVKEEIEKCYKWRVEMDKIFENHLMLNSQQLNEKDTTGGIKMNLKLPKRVCKELRRYCGRYGVTLDVLLTCFIEDLTGMGNTGKSINQSSARVWLKNVCLQIAQDNSLQLDEEFLTEMDNELLTEMDDELPFQ